MFPLGLLGDQLVFLLVCDGLDLWALRALRALRLWSSLREVCGDDLLQG